jgi:hypothetical protein
MVIYFEMKGRGQSLMKLNEVGAKIKFIWEMSFYIKISDALVIFMDPAALLPSSPVASHSSTFCSLLSNV